MTLDKKIRKQNYLYLILPQEKFHLWTEQEYHWRKEIDQNFQLWHVRQLMHQINESSGLSELRPMYVHHLHRPLLYSGFKPMSLKFLGEFYLKMTHDPLQKFTTRYTLKESYTEHNKLRKYQGLTSRPISPAVSAYGQRIPSASGSPWVPYTPGWTGWCSTVITSTENIEMSDNIS